MTKRNNRTRRRKHIRVDDSDSESNPTDENDTINETEPTNEITDLTVNHNPITRTHNTKQNQPTKQSNTQTNINAYFSRASATTASSTRTRAMQTTIPIPAIATYNITTLSAYATPGSHAHARQRRVINEITHLARTTDIILLQETKLDKHGTHPALHSALPHWHFHYNNHPNNTGLPKHHKAGTIIATSPTINNNYTYHTDDLHHKIQGQTQSIKFTGITKNNAPTPMPFRIINVYLPTGIEHHKRRAIHLKHILDIPANCHTIMAGDFNFVEHEHDTTNYSDYHHLTDDTRKNWDELITKHKFWEITQPTHTQLALTHTDPRTSRTDRFYITHNEADCAIYTPTATVTNTPHSIIRTVNKSHNVHHHHVSTHCAVSLTFHPAEAPYRPYKLPPWVTTTQAYKTIFCDLWFAGQPERNPFDEEKRFKQTAKRAHKIFTNNRAHADTQAKAPICELTAAINLLRNITSPNPNPKITNTIHNNHPNLHELNNTTNPNPLRDHIASLIEKGTPSGALSSPGRDIADRSEGEAIFRAASTPKQPIDKVRTILPSTKTHLHHLREKITDETTSDPKTQAQILKKFWGKIWSKRDDAPDQNTIDEYLKTYTKSIDDDSTPHIPTIDITTKHINAPKNTACGPDGMPFALYRNLIPIAAPIIHNIITALAEGVTPPREFNMGEVCFFPKDNSSTVDRTRPITLNNTSNRIVAAVIADTIMPAIDFIVDCRQRGFVRGRRGDDNIHEITNTFYDHLNTQSQHFFLFIDTAKAFDSVDHNYLLSVLAKTGMPDWVINSVRGLMANTSVRPSLKGRVRTMIPINRGVKQGCPLSPLLFLLAYDPLLHNINSIPNAIPWSFADDAAIGHPTMHGITQATKMIDTFATISGFGVNRDKSMILHTRPPTHDDHDALAATDWEGLAFTNKTTYLGVLMGYDIDNVDIYSKALSEFKLRAERYTSALTHTSLPNRILIFNTYLLPLFSYLSRYYLLPYHEVGSVVRRIAARKIIPFNGGAYKYIHLIAPPDRFGFSLPLKDLWALNVADLASQFDYSKLVLSPNPINGEKIAILPGKEYINDGGAEWNGLKAEDHIACAAMELVNDLLPHDPNSFDLAPLDTSKYKHPVKRLRQKIYKIAMTAYDGFYEEDVARKFANIKVRTNNAAKNHIMHGANIINTIPPIMRNHQKYIHLHALATDSRRAKAMHVPPRGPPDNPHPCFLCHIDKDSQHHIYTNCHPVMNARNNFSKIIGITLEHNPLHHTLANKARPDDTSKDAHKKDTHYYKRRTNATIIFNYATWRTRTLYARSKTDKLTNTHLTNKITDTALFFWNKFTPPNWRPTNSRTPPDTALLIKGLFGSASTRTPEQKQKAITYTNDIITSIPGSHYIAYTDGSAKLSRNKRPRTQPHTDTHKHTQTHADTHTHTQTHTDTHKQPQTHKDINTGPCGAGAYLIPPSHSNNTEQFLSTSIREGTNNIGELYAIGLAIDAFNKISNPHDNLTILTDSQLSTLLIEHNAPTKANQKLVTSIRSIYWNIKNIKNIIIRWIPAHVGTIGNETADRLAEDGTRRANLPGHGLTAHALAARITNRSFITNPPPQQPHTLKRKITHLHHQPHHHRHSEPAPKKARTTTQTKLSFSTTTRKRKR